MDDVEFNRLIDETCEREQNWDPIFRWKVSQRTLTWIDQQQTPPRNSKEGCLQKQARLLALYEPKHPTQEE